MRIPMTKSQTKNDPDDHSGPDTHAGMAKSTSKRASARRHHQPQRGTFAPTIPLSPQLPLGSTTLSNIIVVQDIDTRTASVMAFAGLVHMITSPSARASRGAAKY